ncbi:MAG: M24 family metallopeptidase [Bryobacterales bacterium]|nr:M24 family metallopeptidase [Bryobacterales bacterium]
MIESLTLPPETECAGSPDGIAREIRLKEARVREFLERHQLDALVLGRQDNFAWLTSGGDSRIITTTEAGAALAVVTRREKWLLAYSMDGQRILDEETPGQGFEPIILRWYQGSLCDEVLRRTRGLRLAADFELAGARRFGPEIIDLHYPLTDLEIERCRWAGKACSQLMAQVARELQLGMTEREIAARLLHEYALAGITVDVLLVGADERIRLYRHTLPTERPFLKYLLLHAAGRRWGLHANLTRLVHIGQPPAGVRRAIDAAASVAGNVFAMLEPGRPFADILEGQKRLYETLGYASEWTNHFQGGITGYTPVDTTRCLDPNARLVDRQAYDYFITITGAKCEELTLLHDGRAEMPSLDGGWPTRAVDTERGPVQLPDVWII